MSAARLEVHEHRFIRGPRSLRTGNWPAHLSGTLVHSHEGGDVPHEHPDTGPACFALGRKKHTARANGEQFPLIKTEPQTFDVFVLDSALVSENGKLRPITPDDEIGTNFQADIIERKFGMRANVVDLRTRRAAHR